MFNKSCSRLDARFRIAIRVVNFPKIAINRLIIIPSIFIEWMNPISNGVRC